MMVEDRARRPGKPRLAWRQVRAFVVFLVLSLGGLSLGVLVASAPASALEPIVVDPRTDRLEITTKGEIWDNRGDSLQVETAAGLDGVVGRMDVKASTPGTNPNWLVFALTNRTDRHVEHWLTADRYNSIGSGGVWPDLDASRIASVTPSIGFVPERVQSDRADVFRITFEPGQTITFVAELSSERFSRIFLWKPIAYELKVRERQLFNGTLLGLTGLMAIFLTAIFAANHKAIFPTAALVAWCVLVYLCVDFGFFHRLFNLRPEDNAVYRAGGEAAIAASLVIFLYTFLRLGRGHGLVRMLFGVWMMAQLALVAVAVVDPRLAATFARLSFLLIGGAGAAIILFLAVRGQDRAMSMIPTWLLFLVWIFATAATLTGRMSGDIVVAGLAAGLVLVVVLIGFTVTQFAFRSMEPTYGSAPDEQQLRALAVDGVGAATWEWSARRDEIKVSPILESQLGLSHGELSTKVDDFLQHVHQSDSDRFRLVLWSIQERAGGRMRIDFRLRHSDNSFRWFELEAASIESADRRNVRCVGLLRDITDTKRTHDRLLHDSVSCRITSLPNREIFLDRLSVASQHAKVDENVRPTIIFIDLDRFRSINAGLGLQVADSLLSTISRRLKRHLGSYDTLARIGGDQFAMLLLNAQDPRELAALAERIRRSLRSPINIAAQDVVVTGSLGIAVYDGDSTSPEELLKGAEIAMYRAKRKGADRIEIYQPEMRNSAVGLPLEEQELRKAVAQGQLMVHFQPIVYLPTEELAGFEAVLQWEHPRLKGVGQAYIFEIAEKSDLISKVGNVLLLQALEAAKSWQALLPRSEAPLFVSINVSNSQLFNPEIIDEWRQILTRQIVPTECVRLEVTEALAMDNPERAVEMMRVLGAAGAEIVLDEFGAGYSSITYLQRFPIDTIKIDKAIVQAGTAGEGEGGAVIRSVAALAHELGKKVLAEGVEIEEDVVFLRAIGCEYGQGLYYGEPMPGGEVADLIALIAKSERKLEAPGLFRTRPKKAKSKKIVTDERDEQDDASAPPETGPNGAGVPANGGAGRGRPAPTSEAPQRRAPPSPQDAYADARRVIAAMPNVTVRPAAQPPSASPSASARQPVGPTSRQSTRTEPFASEATPSQPIATRSPPPVPASPPSRLPNAADIEPTVRLSTRAPDGSDIGERRRQPPPQPPSSVPVPKATPPTPPGTDPRTGAGNAHVSGHGHGNLPPPPPTAPSPRQNGFANGDAANAAAPARLPAATGPIPFPPPASHDARSDQPPELPRPDVPRSDVPRSDVLRSDVPRSDVPRSDVPRSDVPRSDVPRSDVPRPDNLRPDSPRPEPARHDSVYDTAPQEQRHMAPPGLPFPPDEESAQRHAGPSESQFSAHAPRAEPHPANGPLPSPQPAPQPAPQSAPQSAEANPYAHLPPGIAASLARLAGSTEPKRSGRPQGERLPPVRRRDKA